MRMTLAAMLGFLAGRFSMRLGGASATSSCPFEEKFFDKLLQGADLGDDVPHLFRRLAVAVLDQRMNVADFPARALKLFRQFVP